MTGMKLAVDRGVVVEGGEYLQEYDPDIIRSRVLLAQGLYSDDPETITLKNIGAGTITFELEKPIVPGTINIYELLRISPPIK
jgi:hypothetical protein